MENINSNSKFNEPTPDISSIPRNKIAEMSDNDLLNDDELVAICGGAFSINIDLNPVDLLSGTWKAGKETGRALSGVTENEDRYRNDCG